MAFGERFKNQIVTCGQIFAALGGSRLRFYIFEMIGLKCPLKAPLQPFEMTISLKTMGLVLTKGWGAMATIEDKALDTNFLLRLLR